MAFLMTILNYHIRKAGLKWQNKIKKKNLEFTKKFFGFCGKRFMRKRGDGNT